MAATARVVDLTKAGDGANFKPRRKKEGDYRAKIVKADDHQPNDKNKPLGWVLTIQVEGDARSTYPYYLSPAENQAWKIGTICRAAGLNVKNVRLKFDPNKLVNKSIGVFLADDEYEGKAKSVIDDVFPVSEVGANADEDAPEDEDIDVDDEEVYEDEEPEPEPVPRRRRKPAPEPEEEEEEEEEPAPPPRRTRRKPAPAPEPEEEDEDEEEAPAPPPRKRRRPAPKPAPVEDEDDLDDLDTDDLD